MGSATHRQWVRFKLIINHRIHCARRRLKHHFLSASLLGTFTLLVIFWMLTRNTTIDFDQAPLFQTNKDVITPICSTRSKSAWIRSLWNVANQIDIPKLYDNIFNEIQPTSRVFVEFGFPNCELQKRSTTSKFLDIGWKGLFLDGGAEKKEINCHQHFIYPNNIVDLFEKYDVPLDVDLVSIDIDTTDIWILSSLLNSPNSKGEFYSPKVIGIEYNWGYGPHATIVFPNTDWDLDENIAQRWSAPSCFMGSSAKAIRDVAALNGYTVAHVLGDLVLIRNDFLSCDFIKEVNEELWGKRKPFVWNKTLHFPLSLKEMRSFVHTSGSTIEESFANGWAELWTKIRMSDNVGLKLCFSNAFEEYENKYHKIELGDIPPRY